MTNLIDKTKVFSKKQFYDKFSYFQIQVEPQIRTNRDVYFTKFIFKPI